MGHQKDARRPIVHNDGEDNPTTSNSKPSNEVNRPDKSFFLNS